MAETIQFELVSPARLVKSEPVEMVVVPGSEGNFGVLPRHAPLLSTVRPGVIDIYTAGVISERIFVAGGFCEVNGETCTLLAEEAMPLPEVTSELVAERRRAAEDRLQEAETPAEKAAAEAALTVVNAMAAALN
ncbi:ATP synthase F1 subunit epsilon [Roseospirillum parvum]|uniref:ATP synthase epsilon chain n=1 Tax=Roseospirillum parvum TaxID=83401 RepID=A0A1G7USX7_9PROT|nr:ATP synthase F1 subunit epsilon [Roseospirillum parvum]SDG50438.1 F-type H+-transporting ATPase subunit epsilon [Roseospirillum parvum]